jgi:hypothetical protein
VSIGAIALVSAGSLANCLLTAIISAGVASCVAGTGFAFNGMGRRFHASLAARARWSLTG